jgi:hypothetical protein
VDTKIFRVFFNTQGMMIEMKGIVEEYKKCRVPSKFLECIPKVD